ncbi:hypothetical protein VTO42DRAFT_7583 [Malbranchea cinnamomea]
MARPLGSQTPSPARGPRKDVLASLKLAQLDMPKPALPAELMSAVLDYLCPTDLIRVARTSRRMHEMVYDDTRWVRFLKRMGCWNELEARKHAEQSLARGETPGRTSMYLRRMASPRVSGDGMKKGNGATRDSSGFDTVAFDTSTGMDHRGRHVNRVAALTALKQVKSIRGQAREEYGKVHAALNPFYEDVLRSDYGSTDCLVFRVYDTPEEQAQVLSQLQAFCQCDLGPGWEQRQAKVAHVISLFETAALREFKLGYESGDVEGLMRRYANVLTILNGGQSAIELFLHHNHIVTQKADFGRPMDGMDPNTGNVSLQHTQAFLTRLRVAFNEEVSAIDLCFPHSTHLTAPFLEKVGKSVIAPYFSPLFEEVHSVNQHAYAETVSGTFVQCLSFVENLNPIQASKDEFFEAATRMIEDVFEPHVDLYLAEELDLFRKKSDAVVEEWDRQLSEQAASTESFYMSNVNRQADKKDFLSSFKKVLMAPVSILPSFSSSKSSTTAKSETNGPSSHLDVRPPGSNRSSVLAAPRSGPPTPVELPTTELAAKAAIMNSKLEGIRSLFSIEVALNLVNYAKASLERTARFVKFRDPLGKAAQQQCEAIFVSLLHILGHRHVIAGFDKAVDHLSEYRPREHSQVEQSQVEPLVTFLELVNVGDLIMQMMDVFYEQELVGMKIVDRSDFLDPAVKEKKKFEQMIDERVAAGLNKGIDVLMEEVDYILATKQTSHDFNPGAATDSTSSSSSPSPSPSAQVADVGPSEAAKSITDVVSTHTQMLVGSTDKSTLDVFNQEIGLRLFTSLCKHLKRQRISVEGSVKLISDMNHYFGFIQSMKNEQLLQYFTALRELSQVYLIHPSDAKEMASVIADTNRFHGIFRAEEVYDFAERRADWYTVKKDVERAMFGFGCVLM